MTTIAERLTAEGIGPQIGDKLLLVDGDTEQETEVCSVDPSGSFRVHWYAGSNRFAPNLPGHWQCPFQRDGTPLHHTTRWRIKGYTYHAGMGEGQDGS